MAYQEYPVSKVNPTCENERLRFDWVIPHLKVVIEAMGAQHFVPVAFDGDYEAAVANFEELRGRDIIKKEAALSAGFVYIMVPYTSSAILNQDWLTRAYKYGQEELERYNEEHKDERPYESSFQLVKEDKIKEKQIRQRYLAGEYHQRQLKLAREFRRERYKRLKELKKRDG